MAFSTLGDRQADTVDIPVITGDRWPVLAAFNQFEKIPDHDIPLHAA
ncbi:MAG: hypothetical protein QM270_08140 [Bacillota bacterium]|nr:hypothetical protein [Bacillota bacterium]